MLIVQPDVGMYARIISDVQQASVSTYSIYIQTDALKYSRNKGTLPYIICLLEMNTIIYICIREYDLSNKTGTKNGDLNNKFQLSNYFLQNRTE